ARLLRRDPVLLGAWLYTLSAVVSSAASVSPGTSWRGAEESFAGLKTVLGYLALFLGTRALCPTPRAGRRLLAAAVVAAAVAPAYAPPQFAGPHPGAWAGVAGYGGGVRPFATLGHPNFLAAYLVMALPLGAAYAERAARGRRWLCCAALALGCVLAAAVVVVALSRAAWLAAACMAAVLLSGWWRAGARR